MTREQTYVKQLKALEIYDEAFDPEIKTLARLERELTRAQKEWSASAKKGEKPSFTSELYPIIQKLRAEILQHREALGLTPKSLRRLKGANFETFRVGEQVEQEAPPPETTVLDLIRQKYAV